MGVNLLTDLVQYLNFLIIMNVSDKIKNANYYKYQGIAPDGFTLVPTEILQILSDFDEWKEFKNNPIKWIETKSKEILSDKLKSTE